MTTQLYDSVDVALPTFTFLSAVPAYLSVRTQDDVVCRLASAHSFLHFSSLVSSSSFFLPYTISLLPLLPGRPPFSPVTPKSGCVGGHIRGQTNGGRPFRLRGFLQSLGISLSLWHPWFSMCSSVSSASAAARRAWFVRAVVRAGRRREAALPQVGTGL